MRNLRYTLTHLLPNTSPTIGRCNQTGSNILTRWYSNSSNNNNRNKRYDFDWDKLRPMIKKRIENRAGDYPIKSLIPVAQEVLRARASLLHGVSTLLNFTPAVACKFCPEVYVGQTGHVIKTCPGFKGHKKIQSHRWVNAALDDILVPVHAFHLDRMFQDEIKHQQRFDFERVPAVVELCWQAGAHCHDVDFQAGLSNSVIADDATSMSNDKLRDIANTTMKAWEILRQGVEKLLLVYPVKVCKHCSEVHVGPSGHKARLCGVFKYQSWKGAHFWEKAVVDDLVPPNVLWHCRPHDPPALSDEHRNYYGHAPAVVALCCKAGAVVPGKYFCMMKSQGLTRPTVLNASA